MTQAQGFDNHCLEAARRFLRTAVVIDNQAFEQLENLPPADVDAGRQEVRRSGASILGKAATESRAPVFPEYETINSQPIQEASEETTGVRKEEDTKESRSHSIKARELIQAFTDEKIICSVYEPRQENTREVEKIVRDTSHSDLLVVDWFLQEQNNSELSRKIIAEVLAQDLASGGIIRHIAVYTGETVLSDIARQLHEHLHADERLTDITLSMDEADNGVPVLIGTSLRILFVSKRESLDSNSIEEEKLPDYLIKDYAKLTTGILPSLALHAIATIREAAHHSLATFNREMDGAFITHRCLIPDPDDAEGYIEGVFGDHFRSLLAREDLGSRYANADICDLWVEAETRNDGGQFNSAEGFELSNENAKKRIRDRPEGTDEVKNFLKQKIKRPGKNAFKDPNRLHEFFYKDAGSANLALMKFSRITMLDFSNAGSAPFRDQWQPVLMLGVIIKLIDIKPASTDLETGSLLLCTQPRCDSVRLEPTTDFPFLKVTQHSSGLTNLVIPTEEGVLALYVDPKPKNLVMIGFSSTTDRRRVLGEKTEDGKYTMTDIIGNTYQWIATLTPLKAQHFADALGSRTHSVGIDEFEWLRIRG